MNPQRVRLIAAMRVEPVQCHAGRLSFRQPDIAGFKQHLTLQIGQGYAVVIRDTKRSDARCSQVKQKRRSQAARTNHQQNNPRWLKRMAADFHHAVFWHALAHRQTVNRHQTGNQNRGKRMTDKLEPFVG